MPAVIEQTGKRHTLVMGAKQYDFITQPSDDTVVVVVYAPRMTFRREVPTAEAREQYARLKAQGYVEW